jgi:hypothetical protein
VATTDLVTTDDAALNQRQIRALEQLYELGAEPREPNGEYSSDAKIRALQLVYEGKIGGAGRGQGRKGRKKRAAAHVAEEARRLSKEIANVYKDIMTAENGDPKLKMAAADRFIDIEHKEASLTLKEEEVDNSDDMGKEELIDALFDAFANPEVAAVIEEAIDIPAEDIEEIAGSDEPEEYDAWLEADPPATPEAGPDAGTARRHARRSASRNGVKSANPFTAAAKRRAAD